jgi:hypothetical protein
MHVTSNGASMFFGIARERATVIGRIALIAGSTL